MTTCWLGLTRCCTNACSTLMGASVRHFLQATAAAAAAAAECIVIDQVQQEPAA
jgi:hypothetical protein